MKKKMEINTEKLNPKTIDEKGNLDISDLQELAEGLNKTIFIEGNNNQDNKVLPDGYFQQIICELMSDKNISLKTEYLNQDEQFDGSKIDFMIKKGGFTFAKTHLHNWKKDRVSLGRKSRIEIVTSLWDRELARRKMEEDEHQKNINMQ